MGWDFGSFQAPRVLIKKQQTWHFHLQDVLTNIPLGLIHLWRVKFYIYDDNIVSIPLVTSGKYRSVINHGLPNWVYLIIICDPFLAGMRKTQEQWQRYDSKDKSLPVNFMIKQELLRDRPYNLHGGLWFFFSFRNIFFGQHES